MVVSMAAPSKVFKL